MFARTRLGSRLAMALSGLMIVGLIIGFVGMRGLRDTSQLMNDIAGVRLPAVKYLRTISEGQETALSCERGLLNKRMFSIPELREKQFAAIEQAWEKIDKTWSEYESLQEKSRTNAQWQDFTEQWNKWKQKHELVISLLRRKAQMQADGAGSGSPAIAAIDDRSLAASLQAREEYLSVEASLEKMQKAEEDAAELERAKADLLGRKAQSTLVTAMILGIICALLLGVYFIRSIGSIVRTLLSEVGQLAQAAVEGRIGARGDAQKVNFEFRGIIQGFNDTLDTMEKPVTEVMSVLGRMTMNDYTVGVSEGYHGAFGSLAEAVNMLQARLISIQDVFLRLAKGDTSRLSEFRQVGKRSENDQMMPAAAAMLQSLHDMIAENKRLAQAVIEGRLDARSDASRFEGVYNELMATLNKLMESTSVPVAEALQACARLSVNDIDARMTGQYAGTWNEMKLAINGVGDRLSSIRTMVVDISNGDTRRITDIKAIGRRSEADQLLPAFIRLMESVNDLHADTSALVDAAIHGRLETRVDASKHMGVFHDIVQGINGTLDTIVGKLEVIPHPLQFMDRDFGIQYINKAGADLLGKSKSALMGLKCSDVWNTAKCRTAGCPCYTSMERRDSYTCTNETRVGSQRCDILCAAAPLLDARGSVVGAFEFVTDETEIKTAARVAAKVSEYQAGETARLTSTLAKLAHGDLDLDLQVASGDADTADAQQTFEAIANAVRGAALAVSNLVADANMLSEAAVSGTLNVRADTSGHNGEFRKVVQGVNDTLDAVIGPLNVAAGFISGIARGEHLTKITDEYHGDFNVIKNNINTCIDMVNAVLSETLTLSEATSQGKLSARADVTRVQGGWRQILDTMNSTLDGVVGPLNEAASVLDRLAENDLTARMEGSYQGDYATIKHSMNSAMDALEEAISQTMQASATVLRAVRDVAQVVQETGRASQSIASTIAQVAAGSTEQSRMVTSASASMEQLSKAIDEVAKGSQTQAKTVESTASLVQQITSAIDSVARTAQEASMTSLDVAEVAKSGGESVMKSVEGMNRIKETTDNVASAITQLGENSKQIGVIVETIDDIAEQTNLLALNAAIEAARAGEHGKGFAVVADEVRKLAERSSHATKEIAALIGSIQQMTGNAVEAMNSGSSEVQIGTKLANEAGIALTRIQTAVNGIVGQIEDMSAATEQMSASSTEIVRAMEGVSAITEECSATAQEMSASSVEVASSVEQIAAVSEENAASAEEVSAASQQQNASVEMMSSAAEEVGHIAEQLQATVSRFRVSDSPAQTETRLPTRRAA